MTTYKICDGRIMTTYENAPDSNSKVCSQSGYIVDKSYSFILETAENIISSFQNHGKYCSCFEINKVSGKDGGSFYELRWY